MWHVLEGRVELVLATARHIRNIPGRKSDVNDAPCIAELLAHGLIRGSVVPPAPIQEGRDLSRTRKQLVREIAQHTLRIQKTLETANLKLTGVLSDILGVSGRAVLQALVAGETNSERLAELARGRRPRGQSSPPPCTGGSRPTTASSSSCTLRGMPLTPVAPTGSVSGRGRLPADAHGA